MITLLRFIMGGQRVVRRRRPSYRRRLFTPRLWLAAWRPSSQSTQAMLAEMLSQGLASQMSLPDTLKVVAQIMHRSSFGTSLQSVARMVESGEDVIDSFRWAGIPLHLDVQAAIEVGESRGGLAMELAAAARRLDSSVSAHLNAAIGRPRAARGFAASLARLLSNEPMTILLVHDAARLIGARDRHFRQVIRWLAIDIEGGCPFAEALTNYPRVFDALFIECVAHAQTREMLRTILARLGSEPAVQPPSSVS